MKNTIMALALCLCLQSQAHDEGHGPKISDTGKYGGLVSSVILKSDSKKGAKAALVHKAELVRTSDGMAQVYLYDSEMKPLDLTGFDTKGSAILGTKIKGKWKNADFKLELKDKAFVGTLPKIQGRPYDIDITLKHNNTELLTAFDNLD